jgi:hypothetical protein
MFDPMAYLRKDDKSVSSSSFILQQLENDSLKISPQQNYRIVKFNCLITLLMMMVFPQNTYFMKVFPGRCYGTMPKNVGPIREFSWTKTFRRKLDFGQFS